jgi:hypothetical protein
MAKLSLKKTDQFQKYVFEYAWSTDDTDGKTVNDIKVVYDTPGSAISRRSSLALKFDAGFTYVALGLEIPINKVNINFILFLSILSISSKENFYELLAKITFVNFFVNF